MRRILLLSISIIPLLAAGAHASTVTTLSFSGSIYSIYDGSELFGSTQTSYNSGTYSGTISYDPTTFSTCSTITTSGCSWTLSAANDVVEKFTFNGHTATFDVTSGTLQFESGGGGSDQINLNSSGTGFSFQAQFGDTSTFFGSPATGNPALNFNNVALSYGSGSGSSGSTSLSFAISNLSAGTVAMPEPGSLSLLGIALAGLGLIGIQRRKR